MELNLSEEQELLRDAVRSMCERLSSIEIVRSLESDDKGYSEELWSTLRGMDLVGLLSDGWNPVEVAVVCEELGRHLTPSPYIDTAVFGAALLGRTDETVALAWHEAERGDTEDGVTCRFADGKLVGEKILVPFAKAVDKLLVVARDADGIVIVSVDPAAVSAEPEATLASDRRYKVLFDETPGEVVARGWDAFAAAMEPTLVAVGAYAIGAAQRAHEMSVEYANERIQFDRPIGSFQAMAHPLADLATEIGGARTLVHQAAWTLAERRDARAVSAMAKYYACDVFRRTAKFGHQVFGGIGFTLDIDIQLFMRRAKQLEVLWWGSRTLEEIIAAAELDGETPFISPDAVASAAADRA
jgi:alkylation response protein AidB-like acyl-CoA dehydrogenase